MSPRGSLASRRTSQRGWDAVVAQGNGPGRRAHTWFARRSPGGRQQRARPRGCLAAVGGRFAAAAAPALAGTSRSRDAVTSREVVRGCAALVGLASQWPAGFWPTGGNSSCRRCGLVCRAPVSAVCELGRSKTGQPQPLKATKATETTKRHTETTATAPVQDCRGVGIERIPRGPNPRRVENEQDEQINLAGRCCGAFGELLRTVTARHNDGQGRGKSEEDNGQKIREEKRPRPEASGSTSKHQQQESTGTIGRGPKAQNRRVGFFLLCPGRDA